MTEYKKIPNRPPDFFTQLTAGWKMPGWKEDSHYVWKFNLRDGSELIVSSSFVDAKEELPFIVLKQLLDHYIKKDG